MISLQRRQLVGHDILLARHGNHICSMRVDRGNGRVVALLDDGSVDSAPNLISPELRLPETIRSVLLEDRKFFGAVAGVSVVLGGLFFAAYAGLAGSMGSDAEVAELMVAFSAYTY
ncbi:hypothetical protein [Pseudarthrobacter sp. DSP2-3-2b1]|uniref:hypothetical protein n=1 Tax=Pseudarthrobacter sp. DSP2-3-2b1 TaxID=2804661 RepID=UPI003CEA30ED